MTRQGDDTPPVSADLREALLKAGVSEDDVEGITSGSLTWSIEREPAIGISGNEEVARSESRRKAREKNFVLIVYRDGQKVRGHLVRRSEGALIVRVQEFEAALQRRGTVQSPLFPTGELEDWATSTDEPSWELMQWEYRQAAEHLLGAAELPVFPFLFLWRQHLELMLKLIIVRGREALREEGAFPNGHRLDWLWSLTKPFIERTWPVDEIELAGIEQAEATLATFNQVDPGSYSTRYPANTDGSQALPADEIQHFSPREFQKRTQEVSDFLRLALRWISLKNYLRERDDRGEF